MSGNKLWGEIETSKSFFVPEIIADIERSMSNTCLSEFDSDQEQDDNQVEQIKIDPMDPIMLYGISLHKFAAEMTEAIQLAEITIDSNLTILQPDETTPKIPQPPAIYYKHVPNNLNFIPKVKTDFTKGTEVIHPELSSAIAKKVLMQCVATMFAHIGFETTHNNVLLFMTEVLEDFLKKISIRMKNAQENDIYLKQDGFPHFAEKVLTEFGIGGYRGIHDYYQNRVLKYTNVLHKRCDQLVDCYQKLLAPKSELENENNDNASYGGNLEEEEEVIEVQMHPNVEGKAGYASLEPGFQLLNSLEANEVCDDGNTSNLQNITATIIGDTFTKITPPFSKKKRTK